MSTHTNQRITRWRGQDLTLQQIAKESGVCASTIRQRYKAGDRGEHLTRPSRQSGLVNS